jgi:hypothetical protein
MTTVPLTPTELDHLLATLHHLCPAAPPWRHEPPAAGDRGLTLCGPAGMQILLEVPWRTPERLQVSGLLPVSPEGHPYLPLSQAAPAITVAHTRGLPALATAIVRRLLPAYQPLLQAAQARERAHRDAMARQETIAALLAQVPGCTLQQTPGQVHIAGTGPEAAAVWGQATVTLQGDVTLTLHGLSPRSVQALLVTLHLTPKEGDRHVTTR